MAGKRQRVPTYRLSWRDANGERYWFVTWTTDEREESGRRKRYTRALGIAGMHLRSEAERAVAAMQARVEAVERSRTPADEHDTVATYADKYLRSVERSVRSGSLRQYKQWIARFVNAYGVVPLRDITPAVVDAWIDAYRHLAPRTRNAGLLAVSAMFGHAQRHEVIERNPVSRVARVRVPTVEFPPFVSVEEYMRVVDPLARSSHMRAACRLAMFAGMRRGEVNALRWVDVDMDGGVIRITSHGRHETKSGKARIVPMLPPVREALDAARAAKGDKERAGRVVGISYNKVHYEWTRMLPEMPEEYRHLTFHSLRHSYATWLAAAGLPLRALQHALGHADIQMTMLYTHVQPDEVTTRVREIWEATGEVLNLAAKPARRKRQRS
jgi:integrase